MILIVATVTVLGIGGPWSLSKKDKKAAGLCLVWLALFPPIYYLVAFIPRYRYPILRASFMPASFFLMEVARAARESINWMPHLPHRTNPPDRKPNFED